MPRRRFFRRGALTPERAGRDSPPKTVLSSSRSDLRSGPNGKNSRRLRLSWGAAVWSFPKLPRPVHFATAEQPVENAGTTSRDASVGEDRIVRRLYKRGRRESAMAIGPVRFVHAANVYLDVPLNVTEPLSDELQSIAADATITSFERVVTACVERKAHFLLLSGNVFVERHRSLRARVSLLQGLNRLADHAIPVIVVPGRSDPPEAWRAISPLPKNVTVCCGGDEVPVAVIRESRVIATVTGNSAVTVADEYGIGSEPSDDARTRRPLQIGLLPQQLTAAWVDSLHGETADSRAEIEESLKQHLRQSSLDYALMMDTDARTTIKANNRTAHSPGKTQENNRFDTPQSSCTLVDVDSGGAVRCTSIPTGIVGWHAWDIGLDEVADPDDLLHQMRRVSATSNPEPTEQLWLIRWTVRGPARLVDAIEDPDARRQIGTRFARANQHAKQLQFLHTFRLLPANDVESDQQPMAAEFLERLNEKLPLTREGLDALLAQATGTPMAERLPSLNPKLDRELIASLAMRLGVGWFGDIQGEGHAA